MRPKHSVLPTQLFSKSPLCGLFAYALLSGLCVISLAAQTRLAPTQVAPLHGAVQGPFSGNVLRDYNSATDHGNGVSNAIAAAIADCGVLTACSITVPPAYGTGEVIPGFQLNYATPSRATTPGNVGIFDRRYGDARMFVNNNGFTNGYLNTLSGWLYDYYAKAPQNAVLDAFLVRQWSLDGGTNQQNTGLGYLNKTEWATILSNEISQTLGQHLNAGIGTRSTAPGNTLGLNNLVTCYGGFNSQGDLGCHAMDNFIAQGTVEYAGTLSGSPATGGTTLAVAPTQGVYTQGAGRFLARTNAGTISNGTIAAITNNYAAPATITGSATSWPVSTVIAQLGTDVISPGTAVVTPAGFTTGALSALNTSSLLCVADLQAFEMLYPSAVTATTFTAYFTKIHPANAVIASGGVCGYLLDLTADDVTNATFPTKAQTITGTLHFAWPLIASPSMTTASVWAAGGGAWQAITSRWNSTTRNGYVLYPFAEVVSVQQGGTVSNSLTLGPNNVAWTAGDAVSQFLYPAFHSTFGNTLIESYYPNIAGADGFSLNYNLPLQGNEAMITMANNAPASFYSSGGGSYIPPLGVRLIGPTARTVNLDSPAASGAVGVGCISPCNTTGTIIAAGNAVYYDFLNYDQAGQRWIMSANVSSTHYYWAANQLTTPFANTYMAADAAAMGYIATTQARSGAALNSELSGELVFSNTSSASQSWPASYTGHPECQARPQFDAGSTNRFWVTYGSASFTVNFASAVTGVVTYSCVGRQ